MSVYSLSHILSHLIFYFPITRSLSLSVPYPPLLTDFHSLSVCVCLSVIHSLSSVPINHLSLRWEPTALFNFFLPWTPSSDPYKDKNGLTDCSLSLLQTLDQDTDKRFHLKPQGEEFSQLWDKRLIKRKTEGGASWNERGRDIFPSGLVWRRSWVTHTHTQTRYCISVPSLFV